jgi:hypothetical protein
LSLSGRFKEEVRLYLPAEAISSLKDSAGLEWELSICFTLLS